MNSLNPNEEDVRKIQKSQWKFQTGKNRKIVTQLNDIAEVFFQITMQNIYRGLYMKSDPRKHRKEKKQN